jgi:TRAP-type C4-dicarboxylate transport system substrate-binding protein
MFALAGGQMAPPMTSPELREAMRDGKLDGVMTSLESLVGFRVYEQARHATFGGLASLMSLQPLLISKIIWDGLSTDEQYALELGAEAADKFFEPEQRDVERKAREVFTQAGVTIHTMPIDEYEGWLRIAKDTVWPQYRKLSPQADELFVTLMTSIIRSDVGASAARPSTQPSTQPSTRPSN